uniref:Ubiquitin-like modifier-activating enzyme ATG7 (ATG12-activating enzyme E1 ATG7) (Autophagy-related protein 7) n=1 Tax=Ganoderma boninense TaxID=34458 RepID=A0A5K1JXE5_9APHY|nr:Ubiquitin-like modifier-activating enzyme ATG7 (ATG12-activating enzyme E1 ATG7) (Autophagy-related protein 7) [Ganoderma boninense]
MLGRTPQSAIAARGSLKNFNTIEDFKNADKAALFGALADKIWTSITVDRLTALLTRFLIITFADLKKYKYYYWFAFPAFAAKPAWEIDGDWASAESKLGADALHASPRPFFLVRTSAGQTITAPVEEYQSFFANVPPSERAIGFVDPSAVPTNPGWPLRNLLAYLRALYPNDAAQGFRILCWRNTEAPTATGAWKSHFGVVKQGAGETPAATDKPSAVGWEKNVHGKLGARVADLTPMMDPTCLCGGGFCLRSIWRRSRAALFAAWGWDAWVLRRADAHGIISLYATGPPVWAVNSGAAKGKVVLNAALGFDTFLVMQHGARKPNVQGQRLGCYYCNDIVTPSDVSSWFATVLRRN